MPEHVKTPDPARRSERSRQAILTAATELVSEVGYQKLTIEGVASRAGVGKQTIYRWWPDKGAVVLDAYLALTNADAGLTFPTTDDLEADLRLVLTSTVGQLADASFARFYRSLLTAIQNDEKLARQLNERLLGPWLEATKERLRVAVRAGEIADADLDAAVDLFYGSFYYRWLLRTGPLSTEYCDSVVALLLRALRP
ncbi:DNA-binding transcriptional regulator, AcrR family [Amycolatopsis xylanica]|uniref:DNA-binding transcriptional regulator, AcrR family n=1 Tax=Amycolatopsis xylanica TaxID=589385 RepID=A0A1H3N706_9PSEU|nr:TetR/AcrR family transcriptional regulator [Amycolatopsis xylanica]SDY84460.1 DNA-binding transcriptional regulator, AcrR family [Amycolatopsis xylanica]